MYNTHSLVEILQTNIKFEKKVNVFTISIKDQSQIKSKTKKMFCCSPVQDRSVCFLVDLPDIPNNLA